jgi:hypothetical protein
MFFAPLSLFVPHPARPPVPIAEMTTSDTPPLLAAAEFERHYQCFSPFCSPHRLPNVRALFVEYSRVHRDITASRDRTVQVLASSMQLAVPQQQKLSAEHVRTRCKDLKVQFAAMFDICHAQFLPTGALLSEAMQKGDLPVVGGAPASTSAAPSETSPSTLPIRRSSRRIYPTAAAALSSAAHDEDEHEDEDEDDDDEDDEDGAEADEPEVDDDYKASRRRPRSRSQGRTASATSYRPVSSRASTRAGRRTKCQPFKKAREALPEQAVKTLQAWAAAHFQHPYPNNGACSMPVRGFITMSSCPPFHFDCGCFFF